MAIFDQFFGRRDPLWFENGAAGARQGRFDGHAFSGGRRVAVLGTAVSREGVAFVSPTQLSGPEVQLDFALRARLIKSRVRIERGERMQAPERIVHRYFCTFTAIAADDWDAVVRYVENKPEPKAKTIVAEIDEDFRTLPTVIQNEIVAQLVRVRRLGQPRPGTAPLIRVRASSPRERGNGRSACDVIVHSRIIIDHHTHGFDSRFRVYADGTVELLD